MAKEDFDNAIVDIKTAASSAQELDGLRAVRVLLAGAAFKGQLDDAFARSHNQPDQRMAMATALTEIKFAFRDQLADRVEQHSATGLVAIGGGTALSVGDMLAATTQFVAYPPLALIPLATGVYYGWRGMVTAKRLALEISALNDIIGALDGHIHFATKDE